MEADGVLSAGVGITVELGLGGGMLSYESKKISSWAPFLKLYKSV